jgi:hypothetical protein
MKSGTDSAPGRTRFINHALSMKPPWAAARGQDAGVLFATLKMAVLVDFPILPETEVLRGDTC